MEQLTFSQHVAANGGSLPWQDAVRLTLLTIQTISAQADPETTYMDVCPEQIVLSKDAREVLSCGKPHSLKEWDAADAANPQLLPWEFWNAWSARTPAAQVYPVAACLFGALSGHLPMAAKARLNGAALRTLPDIPDALNNVLQKGLALNAADRWPSLEAFRAALVDATKIEIAVDDTPEKTDDTPALQAGQLDLSKVRTVDAPKGPQAVYKPTAQKKSVKLGPLLPVAVLSVAFLGGLLAYQFTLRGTPTAEELFLPTATAKTSSSSKAAEPEREAASSAAESEAASSSEAAASSPAASRADCPSSSRPQPEKVSPLVPGSAPSCRSSQQFQGRQRFQQKRGEARFFGQQCIQHGFFGGCCQLCCPGKRNPDADPCRRQQVCGQGGRLQADRHPDQTQRRCLYRHLYGRQAGGQRHPESRQRQQL